MNVLAYSVSGGVELGQELAVDKVLDVVDHEEHDGLWDEVAAGLGHDLHVRVDQVADRLHLALQLWVDGAQGLLLALKTETRYSLPEGGN